MDLLGEFPGKVDEKKANHNKIPKTQTKPNPKTVSTGNVYRKDWMEMCK